MGASEGWTRCWVGANRLPRVRQITPGLSSVGPCLNRAREARITGQSEWIDFWNVRFCEAKVYIFAFSPPPVLSWHLCAKKNTALGMLCYFEQHSLTKWEDINYNNNVEKKSPLSETVTKLKVYLWSGTSLALMIIYQGVQRIWNCCQGAVILLAKGPTRFSYSNQW